MEGFSETPRSSFNTGIFERLHLDAMRRQSDKEVPQTQIARTTLSGPRFKIEDDLLLRDQKTKAKLRLLYTKSRAKEKALMTGIPEINRNSRKIAEKKEGFMKKQKIQEDEPSKNQVFEVRISLSNELNSDKNTNIQIENIQKYGKSNSEKKITTSNEIAQDKNANHEAIPKSHCLNLQSKPNSLLCLSPRPTNIGYGTGFDIEFFRTKARPIIDYKPWIIKDQ